MKLEEARVAAYTALQACVDTMSPKPPVQWDNRNLIDKSQQVDPFIAVDFIVGAAVQKSLGETKVVRYIGQLAVLVCVKEGRGIAYSLTTLDTLCLALGMKNFSGLQTEAAMPQQPLVEDGWHLQPLSVPFWFDDIVTG